VQAEGVIVFDEIQGKVVFSEVPPKFSSPRQIAINKLISISKREHKYIMVLFPMTKVIEHNMIIEKTEEIFNNVWNNV